MSEMTVGCIRTTLNPPLASGIYEALLEKANRDAAELADRLSGLELSTAKQLAELERERDEAREDLENMQDQRDLAMKVIKRLERERDEARKESEEQARLLGKGGSREARLTTERDHYKQAVEEISVTIQEYKDSMIQEPSEDFIWAIKVWADKKLKKL
jgi:chromosome segregation ATPase